MKSKSPHTQIDVNINIPYQQHKNTAEPFVGTPLYDDQTTLKAGNGRFVGNGCHDVWAAVLFLLGTAGLIVGASLFFRNYSTEFQSDFEFQGFQLNPKPLWITFVCSACASILLVTVCIFLMREYPKPYIIVSNIVCILMFLGYGVATYMLIENSDITYLIIFILLSVFQMVWLWLSWSRIPLTALLLSFTSKTVLRYPATIFVSVLGFIANVVYLSAGILCLINVFSIAHGYSYGENKGTSSLVTFLTILTTFMCFWGSQVISNVVHVTVSGVAATAYFLGTFPPSHPTWKSFVRATTTSFGSICFGSLVVAILQLIRAILKGLLRNGNTILRIFVDCIMGVLESLMEWFNIYAFAYISIYGDSYLRSAKKAWNLISSSPCAVMFNDSLIDNTMFVTSVLSSLCVCVAVYFITKNPILVVIAIFWTMLISILYLRVITSGEIALFVCVADAPDALEYSEPELHMKIQETLNEDM